jgi:hypothetical protein
VGAATGGKDARPRLGSVLTPAPDRARKRD